MKKIISFLLSLIYVMNGIYPVSADEVKLYAKSAILMDAENGKILYGKSEKVKMANASTTKIMTCLYVLEHCNLDDLAVVSKNAASQPKVRLGVQTGEKYKIRDLLYGLMLESFNDCAVVLAEHAAGSVENFSKKINKEAEKIGAKSTHFVSPNGLDASDSKGSHGTTAYDLALIMRECIKNQDFLTITRQKSYSFHDDSGKRSFTCNNHNALLSTMSGAISGKTGYTSKAGYCYVGAVEQNGMKMIAVVLASGWPPNKSYKWADVRSLVEYGTKNFEYQDISADTSKITKLPVKNGLDSFVTLHVQKEKVHLLLKKTDKVRVECKIPKEISAPLKKGQKIGEIRYIINGKCVKTCKIIAENEIRKKDYWWYLGKAIEEFSL